MDLKKGSLVSGDAGHNCYPDTGASGYKVEDNLTKEVWNLVQAKLKNLGYAIKDCTPWGKRFGSVNESLSYRVSQANSSNSALHLCIHFNAGGGNGVECWISGTGGQSEGFAKDICTEISKLGYFNRGVKVGNLYIPKATKMACVLIECAFVDSKSDMNKYNGEALANAIVKAISGSSSSVGTNPQPPITPPSTGNNSGGTINLNAEIINDWLYVRDSSGNVTSGKINISDKVQVLDISYSSQLALIKYSVAGVFKTDYVSNATNCIKYYYQDQYQNGSTKEIVYEDSSCTKEIGSLNAGEKATPLYKENGVLHIVYSTDKGKNTKSGFVKYNGGFTKF